MVNKKNKKHNIRCLICGKFISIAEFEKGLIRTKFIPDSHFSSEEIKYYHKKCSEVK